MSDTLTFWTFDESLTEYNDVECDMTASLLFEFKDAFSKRIFGSREEADAAAFAFFQSTNWENVVDATYADFNYGQLKDVTGFTVPNKPLLEQCHSGQWSTSRTSLRKCARFNLWWRSRRWNQILPNGASTFQISMIH